MSRYRTPSPPLPSPGLAVVALILGLWIAPPARGEVVGTLFLGNAEILESDLRLTLPGGTDLRFEDVAWDDASFDDPPYYGLRLAWWLRRTPEWGVVVDFTHAKALLEVGETVPVRGRRGGLPVDGAGTIRDDLDAFELSHGLNTLTVSGFRRWGFSPARPGVSYFAGLGAGLAVPHVEARVGELRTSEYQVAGPALQAVAGLDTLVTSNVGVTLEARVSWVDVEADLTGGGTVETDLWFLQLVAGLSLRD